MKTLLFYATVMLFIASVAHGQDNATFEISSQNFQGTISSEIALGDINLNGFRNIYHDGVADSNGSSMYSFVYNNDGSGTLNDSSPFTGTGNGVILAKDYDNDGDDDYAKWGATDASGNHVGVLMRNNGDGTYTDVTPDDFEALYYARGVAEDFDNDGDDDIVVHGYNGTQYFTHYYENHGNLNFTLKQSFYGIAAGSMVAGEIESVTDSGFKSVVHSGGDGAQSFVFILRNNDGWFTEENVSNQLDPSSATAIVLIDIDGDNFLDYGGIGNSTEFKLNDGTGNFPGPQLTVPFPGMNAPTLLAFNADNQGKDELFIAGRNGSSNISRLYKINGDNTFTMIKSFPDPFFQGDAAAVDVNSDGYLDLFCSGNIGGFFPFEEGKTSLYINTTTLGTEEFTQDKVVVYPNPARDIVNLDIPNNIYDIQVTLSDMSGRNIPIILVNGKFDISNLSAGTYLVTVRSGSQYTTERIIKQ